MQNNKIDEYTLGTIPYVNSYIKEEKRLTGQCIFTYLILRYGKAISERGGINYV